ncbi:DUF58 domain-containing protein [Mycetocola reblochoni]|uniref:DUF58 domain-containing protein n=2 Tax=Mycetocola reblochoni TaxID=331618 RepID=A0A1R4ICU7_9MICO|nr:DUF58 domain-containing protein [Mycetocola reblochoni]RLP69114.1 DUF58 domain-containing protein [Mycetocola reblochoni]SJN17630.1 hypothetical protein FM119_01065 [Mycetocola reblochoni REB411]
MSAGPGGVDGRDDTARARAGLPAVTRTARRLLSVSRSRLRPVRETVTPLGWTALGGGALFGLSGVLLGWTELIVVGAVLLAAAALAALSLFGRPLFRVTIELSPVRVVEGERALGRLLVVNEAPLRSLPVLMEVPVGRGAVEFRVPSLRPDESHEELFAVPTRRRSVILAGPARSIRGDALGLFRRAVSWTERIELFVHPETRRLSPTATGVMRDLDGRESSTVTDNDLSFRTLRDYVPGDDIRFVHWRSSARTGSLLVRQFEETRRSRIVVFLTRDARAYDDGGDGEDLELAVRASASIAAAMIRSGRAVSLLSEGVRCRTHTPTALLDDCARLVTDPQGTAGLRERMRPMLAGEEAPGILVIVGGRGIPVTELRSAGALVGRGTAVVHLESAPGMPARVSSLGDIRSVRLGALDQLDRALGVLG